MCIFEAFELSVNIRWLFFAWSLICHYDTFSPRKYFESGDYILRGKLTRSQRRMVSSSRFVTIIRILKAHSHLHSMSGGLV